MNSSTHSLPNDFGASSTFENDKENIVFDDDIEFDLDDIENI